MSKHIGVYPGTFDPLTKGHLDIIERGLNIFDELVVGVAESTPKSTLFTIGERLEMIGAELEGYENVRAVSFNCLLVDFIRAQSSKTILRGLRVMSDFEYEFQMALTNRKLAPDIETVFMMTAEGHTAVSSRFIKEIGRLGGDLSGFVTPGIEAKLVEKFGR